MSVERIKSQLRKFSAKEVIDLEAFVSRLVQQQAVSIALERRSSVTTQCVHCHGDQICRWGKAGSGSQRFRCRDCRMTFTVTRSTPFFRLRNRHLWSRYLGLMTQHVSLKRLRDDHKIPLSIPTLHRWRHRFLASLVANPTVLLAGVVEADEKFFRTAYKGSRGFKRGNAPQQRRARRRGVAQRQGLGAEQVPTLTAMDRSGAIYQAGIPDLRHKTIANRIAQWIEPASVLCTDGNQAYPKAAKLAQCLHVIAKTKNRTRTHLSIGRIDAYHRDVENLVNRRCMGVSTRYLTNYFGWARRITQHKPFGNDWLGEMLT